MTEFVPQHLGFGHISRDEVISQHTRPLAQELFSSGTAEKTSAACLRRDLHLYTEVKQLQLFPTILQSPQAQASGQANDGRHNFRVYCVCPRTILSRLQEQRRRNPESHDSKER